MNSLKTKMLMTFLCGFALVVLSVGVAYAYTAYQWNTYSPKHAYDSTYPTGAWRTRAANARTQWNNVTPTTFTWGYDANAGGKVEYKALCCGRLGETGYWWTGIPYLSKIKAAFPRISSGYTWYTGTGTPPSGQFDLYSVLTHEFGHGSGLYSHSSSGSCSGSSGPTMCPAISATKTYWRTLAQQDKDRSNANYP